MNKSPLKIRSTINLLKTQLNKSNNNISANKNKMQLDQVKFSPVLKKQEFNREEILDHPISAENLN